MVSHKFAPGIFRGINDSVCPVLVGPDVVGTISQSDAVIQPLPAASGGQFYVSPSLDRTVFSVFHIVTQSCSCDQLLIQRVGDIAEKGSFSIQYVPAGELAIDVDVLYGKVHCS